MKETPCDWMRDENGLSVCPYEDSGVSESERCRVCCGLGVDEDESPDPFNDPEYCE